MSKPIISIQGVDFESGFIVEFDENANIKINGEGYPTWVLGEIGSELTWKKRAIEHQARIKQKEENRISREQFWHLITFNPQFTDRYKKEGIYILDNVYVGKSVHVLNRIKQHVQSAINDSHVNKNLGNYIKSKLFAGESFNVSWMNCAPSAYNEALAINNMLKAGHKLLNEDYRMLSLLTNKNSI